MNLQKHDKRIRYKTELRLSNNCTNVTFQKVTAHLRKQNKINILLKKNFKKTFKYIILKSNEPKTLSEFNKVKELLENVLKTSSIREYLIDKPSVNNPEKKKCTQKKKAKRINNSAFYDSLREVSNNLQIGKNSRKSPSPEIIIDDQSIMELDITKNEEIIDLTNSRNDITLIDLTHQTQEIVSNVTPTKQIIEPCNKNIDLIDLTQSLIESPSIDLNHKNIFNPNKNYIRKGLRPIIIDGSNVAMGHTNGKVFSWPGIEICIKYFKKLGHKVTAFVPQHRRYSSNGAYKKLVDTLIDNKELVLTPSRMVDGKQLTPYDDRYIIQLAVELGGVIVSTDNYRDLMNENPAWKDTIVNRLLMFTWVGDMLIFPQDPLGKNGPKLDEFLKFP